MTTMRGRLAIFGVVLLVGAVLAGTFLVRALDRQQQAQVPTAATERDRGLDLGAVLDAPHVVFRSTSNGPTYGKLAAVPLADPSGVRSTSDLSCARVYARAGHGVCLQASIGGLTTYDGKFLDDRMQVTGDFAVEGAPSRARVSDDGTLAAATVFLAGHGYGTLGFSTGTYVFATDGSKDYGNLETAFTSYDLAGGKVTAADLNVWGVTFDRGPAPNTFWATIAWGGKTFLARGDLAARTLKAVREDAECPSLSPDGKHLVYKKRDGSPIKWRYHVMDVATGQEWALPETRSIDDQAEWLDSAHVLYGLQREGTGEADVWVSPLRDGEPSVFIPDAGSPAVVR